MNCPHCRLTNAEDSRFCRSCGAPLATARPAEGERKLVSVLFADVVGSTTMGEQLDPEEVTEIMDGAFALFNAAITRYGGTVARLMGDAVLAMFGAPVAHEDDAERAVRAGLAIQESAQEYAKLVDGRYGFAFRVRVGVHTGLAVITTVGNEARTEYTVMGDAANVASRMQTSAQPGTVLISADTHHYVKRLFDLTPRGATEVRGKSAPMETYEVLRLKAAPGTVRGLEGITSPLVGRDAELQHLHDVIQSTRDGNGSFLAVLGEAGLGKSRLIAEIRAWARDADPKITWLEGRSISYGQTVAYYPWREVVRQAIGVHDSDPPDVVRDRLRSGWSTLHLPEDKLPFLEVMLAVENEATSDSIADLSRVEVVQGIGDAVKQYLAGLADTVRLVLEFDDLHWADEATLELIADVCDLVADHPLVILGILRPDRAAPSWSALDRVESRLDGRFSRMELTPLTADCSQALLGNLLYVEDLPETIRSAILRKSEGNPFYLEEVIRSLIDSNHIVREEEHWRTTGIIEDVAIPDTLRGLLTSRIDRLPDPTKRIAQIAAVIGRTFPYDVLAAVSARAPEVERIEDPKSHLDTLALEELVRQWLDAPDLEYMFKHALTQEAAYELLLIRRRREYHRQVGMVLEDLYAQRLNELVPLLEHHFWLGEDWPRAFRYAWLAGAESERIAALREASNHYDRAYQALKKLPDSGSDELIDAILAWVRTGYKLIPSNGVLGRLAEAEAVARASEDKRRLALVLNWIGNVHFYLGVPSDGIPSLAEGNRLAEELGDREIVIGWTFLISESLIDQNPRAALAQLAHVIEAARKDHYEDIEAHAIAMLAMTHARLGEFTDAEEAMRRTLHLAQRINSPVKEADILVAVAEMYYAMGDVPRGLELSQRAAQLALGVDGFECGIFSLFAAGMGHLQSGAWEEALAAFEDASRQGESSRLGSEWLKNRIQAGHAMAQAHTGSAITVQEMEDTMARARAFDDDYTVAFLSRSLGEWHTREGDYDRAHQYLDAALSYYRRNEMYPFLPATLALLANLWEKQGQIEQAAAARNEAEQIASRLTRSASQLQA